MTAINLNRAIRGPVTAVPVVAGKGVRIVPDTVNNRFVVEADETVLYDGNGTGVSNATLSESLYNFEKIRICIGESSGNYFLEEKTLKVIPNITEFNLGFNTGATNAFIVGVHYTVTATSVTCDKVLDLKTNYTNGTSLTIEHSSGLLSNIHQVVGINRISST